MNHTGSSLANGTLAASVMDAPKPGDWETINMLPYGVITSGHDYVIRVTYAPSASEWVNWRVDLDGSGDFAYSDDAGETWTHGEVPGA